MVIHRKEHGYIRSRFTVITIV